MILVYWASIFDLVSGSHQEVASDGVGFLVRFGRHSLLLFCLLGLLGCLLSFQAFPVGQRGLEVHDFVAGHRASWWFG